MIEQTRRWIEEMVIGLELCPFAEKVFTAETIRYVSSKASTSEDLLQDLAAELQYLVSAPRSKVETTLLIFPHLYQNFLDFNEFTYIADKLVGEMGMRGVVQLAGFHPEYQFDGTSPDAPENYTNRSPYPMLHLLREQSITEVAARPEELLKIPERNIRILKEMGLDQIRKTLQKIRLQQDS